MKIKIIPPCRDHEERIAGLERLMEQMIDALKVVNEVMKLEREQRAGTPDLTERVIALEQQRPGPGQLGEPYHR
jgi:hypothetical protein